MRVVEVIGFVALLLLPLRFVEEACLCMSPKQTAASEPILFAGDLEEGKIYRATVVHGVDRAFWWPVGLRIPFHHGVHIQWNNAADFPQLAGEPAQQKSWVFTFTVRRKEVWKVPNRLQWRTSYECKILTVGRLEAAGSAAQKP